MKAFIFDKDGVLVETFNIHLKAYKKAFEEIGLNFKEEHLLKNYGRKRKDIIRSFLEENGIVSEELVEKLVKRKEELYREFVETELKLLPGVLDCLKYLKRKGYKIGLASSSSKETIKQFMRVTKTESFFDAFTSGDEVKEGKPNPEIFLKCAEKLGVEPKDCVVIEDSVHGVEAAKRAGMKCVAVLTGKHSREDLEKAKPDLILESLEDCRSLECI